MGSAEKKQKQLATSWQHVSSTSGAYIRLRSGGECKVLTAWEKIERVEGCLMISTSAAPANCVDRESGDIASWYTSVIKDRSPRETATLCLQFTKLKP